MTNTISSHFVFRGDQIDVLESMRALRVAFPGMSEFEAAEHLIEAGCPRRLAEEYAYELIASS